MKILKYLFKNTHYHENKNDLYFEITNYLAISFLKFKNTYSKAHNTIIIYIKISNKTRRVNYIFNQSPSSRYFLR